MERTHVFEFGEDDLKGSPPTALHSQLFRKYHKLVFLVNETTFTDVRTFWDAFSTDVLKNETYRNGERDALLDLMPPMPENEVAFNIVATLLVTHQRAKFEAQSKDEGMVEITLRSR